MSTSSYSNIERWKSKKVTAITNYSTTNDPSPIYGNVNPIQRMSSVESDDLPLPPAPAMNYSPPRIQSFPDPPQEILCPQLEQGPPPRYHPSPGYIEPVRSDEIPSNGIYANYRPVSYASTCDASASIYEPINPRSPISLSGGSGSNDSTGSMNSSIYSASNYAPVNRIQVNSVDDQSNLYANFQPSLNNNVHLSHNNNYGPLGQVRVQNYAIGHGVSGYQATTRQLSPHQQYQLPQGHDQLRGRPSNQNRVPVSSDSGPKMHGDLRQSGPRLESLKQTTKEDEVDQLTDLLVQSMGSSNDPDFFGICFRCKKKVVGEGSGCRAMDRIYHVSCFTCKTCHKELKGLTFYNVDGRPLCEADYLNTLEKCSVCHKPILDRILRATGKPYHPDCFTCIVCNKCLDGIPFTVDNVGKIHCIEDFHRKFAPRCYVCHEPILPEPGQHETVRVVALDRSYHVNCYRCEDCHVQLTSKDEGRGCYPLDNHILCQNCNAIRVNALTS